MPFSYAIPTSGPSAGGIGWFDFGNFTLVNGGPATTFSGTLNDGSTVTFDISLTPISGTPRNFAAVTVPTFVGSNFGATGYTGLTGNVALNSILTATGGVNAVNITNIVVKDINNNPVTNYTAILADSERSNIGEIWNWQTNGGNWGLLATLGANPPPLSGLGTQTAIITGAGLLTEAAYVLTTQTPTTMTLTLTNGLGSRQAFSLGFATTHVRIQKNIAGRADPADQFVLNIGGIPSGSATTTGATSGLQLPIANVFATPALTYSISEAMAPGSVSPISSYTQVVSASNATPAGSVPPVGTLPINFTPVLGDDVTYTILNIAPTKFTKTVNKAYADLGEILTYSVAVANNNNFAITNVLVTDPTPIGTTFVPGSLVVVGSAFTGTDPNSGVTLTSVPANTTATLTWQVMVNSLPPISNPVTNVAMVTVPGGTSGPTNAVTTQVNTAYVTVNKTTDKAFVKAGDIITYTLQLNNAGNVAANNVVITDAVPSGTTFVAGSVTGATGTPPTLTLAAPLAPSASTTVTFKVLVGNTVPNPNPIPNTATVNYTYTVNPANPNGATGTRPSNTVTTQANMAIVSTVKTVDQAFAELGAVLTYTLTIQNTGNVAANNVVITDAVPSGTTFVAGSVTGATGTPPTLTLNAPLAPGATTIVTFKVQVGDVAPSPNPIVNTALADFQYTVDPAFPNGASGTAQSNNAPTQINDANITTVKTVDKAFADIGAVLTYTLVLTNTGNVPATNVTIADPAPAGTTFINGSLIGATGTPPTLTLNAPIMPNASATVSYQVLVNNTIPSPNPIENIANVGFTFTLNPANPDGQTGTSSSNPAITRISSAIITTVKTADLTFADVGDTITYAITVTNSGNVTANNVVITDTLPVGTSFIAGSLTNATGAPPTFTLTAPVPAGGSIVVTYKVLVGALVPNPNPVENSANAAFTYTVNPAQPNGAQGVSYGNTVQTQVSTAQLEMVKSADKSIAYIGNVITYQIAVTNTGNAPATSVVLTDLINSGLVYVPGSLVINAPSTGDPTTAITLTSPVNPGQTVALSFKVTVATIPMPNPAVNKATAAFNYTIDPSQPNGASATAASNTVETVVFRNNYGQQISDLINSVALEQAALAAIANAEGAKIQRMVAMPNITSQQLLCLNKSVADMMDSLSLLEAILKQKLSVVDCQIDSSSAACK